MTLRLTEDQVNRIDALYKDSTKSTTDIPASMIVEFVELRNSALKTIRITRVAEYNIFKLLLDRAFGKVAPYTPKLLIGYDYEDVSELEACKLADKLSGLLDEYKRSEEVNRARASNRTLNHVSYYLPCKTRDDFDFGVETLYALMLLTTKRNVPLETPFVPN